MHVNIILDILETDSDAAKSSGTVKDEIVGAGMEEVSKVEEDEIAVFSAVEEGTLQYVHDVLWSP